MAVAIMFSGIAAVALPLAQEFGITREIDDRVMCPLPVAAVRLEKMCFSCGAERDRRCVVFPLAYYVPTTPVCAHVSNWPYFIVVLVLASLTSGALGPDHWDQREAAADRPHLRRGGDADYISGLRLLSLGCAVPHPLAADWRA